jgi:hypothetical protein
MRALVLDPRQRRSWAYAAAAVAGPHALRTVRRVRRPEANVPARVLLRRRAAKYARRLANYPRAVLAAPFVAATRGAVARIEASSDAAPPERVLLLGIYRARNERHLAPIVREAAARGWSVRLWSLDRAAPDLASTTVGVGPGAKFPLLDAIAGSAGDTTAYDWVVVTDDDIALGGGRLADLLTIADLAGLDLVQPAHTELSHRDNAITLRRPLSIARRTTFVEIGPLFAVRGAWSGAVVASDGRHTMGWGRELEWADLAARGLRLGVVDAVGVRHLSPAGKTYDWREQHERLRELLDERGLASFDDAQHTLSTWRPWRRRPPW